MQPHRRFRRSLIAALVLPWALAAAGASETSEPAPADPLAAAVSGLELRSIGPALMGGRIADLAIDPRDRSTWYVAVGSGGVWKTTNSGVTWTPVFDDQPSYSVGCVTVDPTTPDTVWVGTGENVSGRHVGWGDGVYKSLDGGGSWRRMGLEGSEHIGKIVVHPDDGDTVWVAAEGPLWAAGGERGVYKTTDGGESWRRVLEIDPDTGVTDLAIDPRDPDLLYAAAYQRRRRVWGHLAGGPLSGIYKSADGGESWRRIERGLPSGDVGKIGLAVSPADPDVVYATIEANEEERGFYRSRDRGESWEKRNSYLSGGTGPHYYQEIVASPHDVDRVYQMDVFLHATDDGGATFDVVGTGREKHSDNHALWIDPADGKHLIAGTDAGLYESFDGGATWRHFPNLPVSQFYKLAVSESAPFYEILGGAQDLGTLLGPARTRNVEGVANSDWYVPLGADGYACAFDPELPIAYMEWQRGRLQRYDRVADELIDIQPQPEPGDEPERWNWDAPLVVSPHAAGRLYFGSQRLWRSDDRGDSWTPVSGDLTRGENRYELPIMDRFRGVDALWDHRAMSWYGTLTTLAESPLAEGLLYAGTDDGLVQVSEDGGTSWRRATRPPGAPEDAFVQDVAASVADSDTVYAALDAHKSGDFRPLLYVSTDRGRSWRLIVNGLPDKTIVWSVVQDHVEPRLLFAGTEFGIYFSSDAGERWVKLSGGVPTIAFRDLAIQRQESDLVGASFGRGFYLLDDYGPLRELAAAVEADSAAALFAVRDAWWFVPSVPMQARGKPTLGSTDFTAANPPFGALFTYYLRETPRTAAETRRAADVERSQAGERVPFPGWERLAEEALEQPAKVVLTIFDTEGRPVRTIEGPAEAGLHRVNWDLRRPPPDPVDLEPPGFRPPWAGDPQGPLAPPGVYRAELALERDGELEPLVEPRGFRVVPVPGFAAAEPDFALATAFQEETAELLRAVHAAGERLGEAEERLRHLRAALSETPRAEPGHRAWLEQLEAGLAAVRVRLLGDPIRGRWSEPSTPSVRGRVGQVAGGHWESRQAPTAVQRRAIEIAREELAELTATLVELVEVELPALEAALAAAGAPSTPGRTLR